MKVISVGSDIWCPSFIRQKQAFNINSKIYRKHGTVSPRKFGSSGPMIQKSCPRRAANQYGISVFCTDFTCKIREYEFGLENTEIELCQFCHLKYCCQNKAYLFWVANQSGFVAFYALEPSNTSLITKTFNLLSSTCSSSMLSCLTSCSCSTGSIH